MVLTTTKNLTFRWAKKTVFALVVFSFTSLSSSAQRLDFLNSYWYVIQDTSSYPVFYFRITLEDSLQKSVRIFTRDSTLVYQLLEKNTKKRQPWSQTEIWYNDAGQKSRVALYSDKKKRKESTQYYETGEKKSLIITENQEIVEEIYFSKTGEEILKPQVTQALPKGGIEGWTNYLRQNLVYPEDARFLGKEGLVYLHFYVTEEGKMVEIEIMNPEENHPSLNKEAFRVAASYPHLWSPSKENGEVKKSEIRLPIRFKLTD